MSRGRSFLSLVLAGLVVPLLSVGPLDSAGEEAPPRTTLRHEPMLEERIGTGTEVPVLLHFTHPEHRDAALPHLPGAYPLQVLPALVVPGVTLTLLRQLGDLRGAAYAEAADKPLRYALDSVRQASRTDLVTGDPTKGLAPLTLRDGTLVDGTGIGVALVDTGVDTTHPDLHDAVGSTWVVTPTGVQPAPNSDPVSPHGTHMAGIVASRGTTDPALRGIAPNATLHALDIGPGATNLFAVQAFEWLLLNQHDVDPPIRVVLNAWGCFTGPCRTWDPQQAHNQLASRLAENGTIVIFPVGNEGGSAFVSTVNPEATNPTPGILGVASYDDRDIGTRQGCHASHSSGGAFDDATTWPDVAVPGSWVWSPNGVYVGEDGRVPVADHKSHTYFHGTSAAAAHLAGIAALALDAAPDLQPAEFEYATKQSGQKNPCGLSYVRADPTHPWGETHPRMGHGLVDARAIVDMALKGVRVPKHAKPVEEPPSEWLVKRQGVAVHHTLHLTRDGGMAAAHPRAPDPAIHPVSVHAPVIFESDPFLLPLTSSGARLDLWWGTFRECICARVNAGLFGAHLDVVHVDGATTRLGSAELNSWYVHPATPTQRPLDMLFPETTIAPGERLRVTVAVMTPPSYPLVGDDFVLYTDAPQTASRIALGDAALPQSNDPVWCQVRQDCTDVGGDRMVEGLHCDSVPMRVEWHGPSGSSITLTCSGLVLGCSIPPSLTPTWSTCSADSIVNPSPTGDKVAICRYHSPDGGTIDGTGRCVGLVPRSSGD